MDAREMTELYYSHWLGADENLFAGSPVPMMARYTTERNAETPGYGCRFDLWAIETEKGRFISYGDAAQSGIPELETSLQCGQLLSEALRYVFGAEPERSIKYMYVGKALNASSARVLTREDYPAYERFFRDCHSRVQDVSWLREYFTDMVGERLCCGVFADGLLVSCTDAPTVPYMADAVAEIGVNTLEAYRGKGYAHAACARCVQEVFVQNKCPLWSTGEGNIASQRLAEGVGFVKFGDAYTLCLG